MAQGKHDADLRRKELATTAAEKRKMLAQERAQDIRDSALDTTGKSVQQPRGRRKTPGTGQRAKDSAGGSGVRGGRGGRGGRGVGRGAGGKGGRGGGRKGGGAACIFPSGKQACAALNAGTWSPLIKTYRCKSSTWTILCRAP